MQRHLMNCLATVVMISLGAAGLWAQEGAKNEGTLTIGGKTYKLKHAAAYPLKSSDEEATGVVISDRKLPIDKINAAVKKGVDETEEFSLSQPYVIVIFKKSGEIESAQVWADNHSFSTNGSGLKGEVAVKESHAAGKASRKSDPDSTSRCEFDFRFDLAMVGSPEAESKPPSEKPGPAVAVKPSVSGTFKGNGKEAKLAFVSARWGEPFNDKPSIKLVFTEKDHSQDPKPDFKATFGNYGSALIISLHEDGSIFGCEVTHTALKKQFSSVGTIKTGEFSAENGKIEGEITTDGEQEFFGDTWEVKIKFVAPLGKPPADSKPAEEDTPKPSRPKVAAKPKTTKPDQPDPKPEPKPAAGQLNVKELALPKDATDLEYKTLVEHLSFKSKSDVKTLAAELAKSLEKQGWKGDGADLINAKSTIMHRSRGEASLTIFVKPDGSGSTVTMFTEGLLWDDK